jgi:DNA-binding response OmpR family regulator/HPt (histidine-containing phosphotransfer) domain-containing protein
MSLDTSILPPTTPAPAQEPVDLTAFMKEARQKFVVGFQAKCDRIHHLLRWSEAEFPLVKDEVHDLVHRLVGLSGSMGFPTVSQRAAQLEALLDERPEGSSLEPARHQLDLIREAFTYDLVSPPAWSAIVPAGKTEPLKVLLFDDDPEQRAVITTCLLSGGHRPVTVDSAIDVVARARAERPSVILLDVNMPGMNGYAACQALKADPEVSSIPVVFVTTRGALSDKLAGLSLGADDYLCKPIEFRELLLRLQLLSVRHDARRAEAPPGGGDGALNYETFVLRARAQLARSAASLALVRLPGHDADQAQAAIKEDVRRRDLLGWYDRAHLAVLFPDMAAADAADWVTQLIQRLPARLRKGMHAGIASASVPTTKTIESMLSEADEALTEARYLGEVAVVHGTSKTTRAPKSELTVLVADDDPEVSRILEAHIRASGFQTILAFDGRDAVQAVEKHRPDAIVLDLMLPTMSGFDVLKALTEMPDRRPRILVLSARSRENDVTQAFEIGADDYMTKPFSPQELMARVTRLLR